MEEKRFVLTGGYTGLLHIQKAGATMRARCALPPCQVYFAYPAENGVSVRLGGTLERGEPSPAAFTALPMGVVLVQNGRVLCTGGFAGRERLREQAELLTRLACAQAQEQAPKQEIIGAQKSPVQAQTQPPATQEPCERPSPEGPNPKSAGEHKRPVQERKQPPTTAEPCEKPSPEGPNPKSAGEHKRPVQERKQPPTTKEACETSPPEESEALKQILAMAQSLFGPLRQEVQTQAAQEAGPDFCGAFAGAVWKKVRYPGSARYYWEGELHNAQGRFILHAMPGEYAPVPPYRGFRRFLRAADGTGYWVRAKRRG